jgi:hypothetical protein
MDGPVHLALMVWAVGGMADVHGLTVFAAVAKISAIA